MAKSRQGQASGSSIPSRLPATRERRPALAALALLLIVGGALGSGWLALRAGDRADFLQVSQEVAQGQRISEDDLDTVSLPEDFDNAIPVSDRDSVLNQYATTRLFPQTVIAPSMLSKNAGVADGQVKVTVQTSSSAAADLENGSNVALFVAGDDTADDRSVLGQVIKVQRPQGDDGLGAGEETATVSVSVDSSCGGVIGKANKDDALTLGVIGSVDDASNLTKTCTGN